MASQDFTAAEIQADCERAERAEREHFGPPPWDPNCPDCARQSGRCARCKARQIQWTWVHKRDEALKPMVTAIERLEKLQEQQREETNAYLRTVLDKERAEEPPRNERGAGYKFDSGKLRMSLLPFDALECVVRVLEFGLSKGYKRGSWREVENGAERYLEALLRHVSLLLQGEVSDRESGLPHVYHVACNALFLCAFHLDEEKSRGGVDADHTSG